METKLFTKKEMLAEGFTLAQVKALVPVSFVKTGGPGRPAAQYSQEQVDQLKAGAIVAAVTVKPVKVVAEVVVAEPVVADVTSDEEPEVVVADETVSEDITEADLQNVA